LTGSDDTMCCKIFLAVVPFYRTVELRLGQNIDNNLICDWKNVLPCSCWFKIEMILFSKTWDQSFNSSLNVNVNFLSILHCDEQNIYTIYTRIHWNNLSQDAKYFKGKSNIVLCWLTRFWTLMLVNVVARTMLVVYFRVACMQTVSSLCW